MYKFFSRLFRVLGVLLFLYSMFFLWAYFVGYVQAGRVAELLIAFFIRIAVAAALFFLGDLMKRILSEEQVINSALKGSYNKK